MIGRNSISACAPVGLGHFFSHSTPSSCDFTFWGPISYCVPTIFSMLQNIVISLAKNLLRPSIAQVTWVAPSRGCNLNSTLLWHSNGLRKARSILIDEGDASLISMLPTPILLLPAQAYFAPLPEAGPLYERCSSGSICSYGTHAVNRWTTATTAAIPAGDAWRLAVS